MLGNFLDSVSVQKIDKSDPFIGGFHEAVQRQQPDPDRIREAVARIPLPFPVKPDPSPSLCTYTGSATKIFYIKMGGPPNTFARKKHSTYARCRMLFVISCN